MLQLITGRAGSGKSEYCLSRIEQLAKEGQDTVLIVPEQSSFSLERSLALRLDKRLIRHVSVKSFRSLCADIFAECGGGARKRASDAVRCALMRRAVTLLGDDIVFFKRHKKDLSFFSLMVSVIEEFKNAGVTPEFLRDVSEESFSELSAQKLREISSVFAAYEKLLSEHYYDSAGEMSAASALCAKARQFDRKTIFLDGFTGFTEPQFSILSALLHRADDVVVTLCCDDIFRETLDPFSAVRKSGRRLLALAKQHGAPVKPVISFNSGHRFLSDGLAALECFLAGRSSVQTASEGVYAISESDPYAEMEAVADEIVFLIREHHYNYKDIVVILRDMDGYRAAVERTFSSYAIPFFCDSNRTMLYSPVTVFMMTALDIADRLSTENILALLKTGLTHLSSETIASLENYLYIWGIDRAGWLSPFDRNPAGFGASADAQPVLSLETVRQDILAWLQPLTHAAKEDAGALIRAAYETFQRCGARSVLENMQETPASEASLALEMIESLYATLAGDAMTASEVRGILAQLAASTPLGGIPPTLDQVSVGTADRMRTSNPRAVFAVGLNEGVFPRNTFDPPILTGAERDLLSQKGAELTGNFENSVLMEELYLYRSLTCAAQRVYLCNAARALNGSVLLPTPKIQSFTNRHSVPVPDTFSDPARFIVNHDTAASRAAHSLSCGDRRILPSLASSSCASAAEEVLRAAQEPSFSLTAQADIPKRLLGVSPAISATRIEDFSKCRFRYFLERMLRVQPIRKAEISPLEAGNFVHSVLEQTLRTFHGDLSGVDDEQLEQTVTQSTQLYIRQVLGADAEQHPRIRYLVGRLQTQVFRLLLHLRDEQMQSDFRPVDFELTIAANGDVDPLILQTPDGHSITVQGKVDRVDLLHRDGKSYLCVVDYKTGYKKFDLNDVLHGLSLQTFVYLFILTKNGENRYPHPTPAAVMYVPADPGLVSDSVPDVEQAAKRTFRMDGMILDDPSVIEALDREGAGLYIPVKRDTKGRYKTDNLASLEKFGSIQQHIESLIIRMAQLLYQGDIEAIPYVKQDGSSACDYCDYAAVCRRDRSEKEHRIIPKKPGDLFVKEDSVCDNSRKVDH